ncbi:dTDP-4-dehydrorhamnose reductase [Cupriavidus sp. WS]|uniref:dTDP-4-dehydrorhamnose reductase n=1 Tax=Cupriavidus sp. WS TaxID=1312922 RepID=UPI000369FD98|nr:dTDP-4-dehydrorhamnose reductase [Cupriavidus sp. WS]
MRPDAARAPVILLTGSNGQVGFELRRSLSSLGKVVALDRHGCDLARPDAIRHVVQHYRPEIIVNAAAYTAVDHAESDADHAFAVNGTAPGILGEEARALGSLLVHYSTDHVFDGRKPVPYVETDACEPPSVYGKSKRAGETAVIASGAMHLVFRTSWVFGAHGENFLKTILRHARQHDSLQVVCDQFGAPTAAALVADVTAHAVRGFLRKSQRRRAADLVDFPQGIFHLAATGATNWNAYAREAVEVAAMLGMPIRARGDAVVPVASSDYPMIAPRPGNARLDCTRLEQCFGLHMPPWQDGMRQVLEQLILDTP